MLDVNLFGLLDGSRITEGRRVFAKNVSQVVAKRFNGSVDLVEVGFDLIVRHFCCLLIAICLLFECTIAQPHMPL